MKLLSICIFIYTIIQSHGESTTYTDKYDRVDLDEILANDRLLTAYVNCLLDHGPCTPDAGELKTNLPDAIKNDCKKCTERQSVGADQVMRYIIDHRPDDWANLEIKYNSDGSYKNKYLESKKADETKAKSTNEDINKNNITEKK